MIQSIDTTAHFRGRTLIATGPSRTSGPARLRGRAFDFSSGAHLDVRTLVARILGLMGSSLEPEVRNEASCEIHAQILDATLARETLGWSPRFGLDEGLRLTIDWYAALAERDLAGSPRRASP